MFATPTRTSFVVLAALACTLAADRPGAQVMSKQKISELAGGFSATLDDHDRFGSAAVSLGDLDSDGVPEVMVGAAWANADSVLRGKAFVLFLNADGTVKSELEIGDGLNGFTGPIGAGAMFGSVELGMKAEVRPELPNVGVQIATVRIVDRVIDARSGTFGVRLELPNADLAIPSGLHCQVRFLASK